MWVCFIFRELYCGMRSLINWNCLTVQKCTLLKDCNVKRSKLDITERNNLKHLFLSCSLYYWDSRSSHKLYRIGKKRTQLQPALLYVYTVVLYLKIHLKKTKKFVSCLFVSWLHTISVLYNVNENTLLIHFHLFILYSFIYRFLHLHQQWHAPPGWPCWAWPTAPLSSCRAAAAGGPAAPPRTAAWSQTPDSVSAARRQAGRVGEREGRRQRRRRRRKRRP